MQEFGIVAEFNNEKVVFESDIIFVCVLPGQAGEVFKEIKYAMSSRIAAAKKNSKLSMPLIVSCLAATGIPKLKLMLMPEACFIRTRLNVALMRRYLQVTGNEVPKYASHPTKPQLPDTRGSQDDHQNDDASNQESLQQKSVAMQQLEDKLRKCLSTKAIKIGKEHGVTAEFII